jgi:hypothetical protein
VTTITESRPGTLSYAGKAELRWNAYWDDQLARQQRQLAAEQASECIQCGGSTRGSRIGWICGECRMARS